MTFDQFITKWQGKGIDFDGVYGDQCMDLMHQYVVEVLGLTDGRILAAPAAKDVWLTTPFGKDKFDAIPNSPTGIPQTGDIVLFGTEIGPYGHVAIVVAATVNSLTTFDQNWNGHAYCEKVVHGYGGKNGVLGWLRFKAQPAPADLQAQLDAMRKARDDNWNLHLADQQTIASLQTQLKQAQQDSNKAGKFDQLHQGLTDLLSKYSQ